MLDLKKLEQQLNQALKSETEESLQAWLSDLRKRELTATLENKEKTYEYNWNSNSWSNTVSSVAHIESLKFPELVGNFFDFKFDEEGTLFIDNDELSKWTPPPPKTLIEDIQDKKDKPRTTTSGVFL